MSILHVMVFFGGSGFAVATCFKACNLPPYPLHTAKTGTFFPLSEEEMKAAVVSSNSSMLFYLEENKAW